LEDRHSSDHKSRVAREAAVLLYTQQEKEYMQAKRKAAATLRTRILPSNKEIAQELDRLADETEGEMRKQRLIQMRKDALAIMVLLGECHPRLVGSVWRGTASKNSDIDVETFSTEPQTTLEKLKDAGIKVQSADWKAVTKGKKIENALHIYITLPSSNQAEVIVRDPDKMTETERDEIYGDTVKGLNMHQLRRVLTQNPTRKFTPP
jgi:predicted nucleotidyltransferase